ncbi:hypothetical protein [Paraburkholderia sp. 32]|uniref:hypothetical protein n=1 Tax=Paraburkholderia sp. 32 TaxID=2991057 RepID=UPI003D2310D6
MSSIIRHHRPGVEALSLNAPPALVFCTTNTYAHLADIVEWIAPQGRFALIDAPAGTADIGAQMQLLAFSGVNRSRSPLHRVEHVPS